MIKIKTFTYEASDFTKYNKRETVGNTHYYDLDASKIDREINNFTEKHKVISLTPMSFVKGNNPPVSIITYTIVYEDDKN